MSASKDQQYKRNSLKRLQTLLQERFKGVSRHTDEFIKRHKAKQAV